MSQLFVRAELTMLSTGRCVRAVFLFDSTAATCCESIRAGAVGGGRLWNRKWRLRVPAGAEAERLLGILLLAAVAILLYICVDVFTQISIGRLRDGLTVDVKPHPLRLPVAWVHIPKTGTTFVNTLLHSLCRPPIHPMLPHMMQHAFWDPEHRSVGMSLSECSFT